MRKRTAEAMDAWVAELAQAAKKANPAGQSLVELCAASGLTNDRVRDHLRLAIAAGRWEYAGNRLGTSISGGLKRTPVYRPVKR